MTTRNDITGDKLQSKVTTDTYRDNYDLIFGKKKQDIFQQNNEPKQLELTLHERNLS